MPLRPFDLLRDLGTSRYVAEVALTELYSAPATGNPDSSSWFVIVTAVQRGLMKAGYANVRCTGILDEETGAALSEVVPRQASRFSPDWQNTPWITILLAVHGTAFGRPGELHAVHALRGGRAPMGAYFEVGGGPYGPIPSASARTPPGPLGGFLEWMTGGPSMNFGAGRAPTNMVPIPRRKGETYETFRGLQRAINRLLSRTGGRIGEDGVIGSRTLSAYQKVRPSGGPTVASTKELASAAPDALQAAKKKADALGISAGANQGGSGSPASAEPAVSPALAYKAPMSTGSKIILAVVAGAIVAVATKKRKTAR